MLRYPTLRPMFVAAAIALSTQSASAQVGAPVDIVEALTCKISAPAYIGFAMNLDDRKTGYRSLDWVKQPSGTQFLSQYQLPRPIVVAGYRTSTIVFSGSGVAAVLDMADPASVAARLGLVDTMMSREEAAAALGLTAQQAAQLPPVTAFRGERVVLDTTDEDPQTRWRLRTRIVQSVANDAARPGKSLLGCAYSIEVLDH